MDFNMHVILNIFHLLFVAPLLIYVGVQRASLPEWAFNSLLGLGIVVLMYQLYKSYIKYSTGALSLWVNLMHVLIIAPLLIYIGAKGKDTPRPAFEMLLLTAFAAFGYHLYYLVLAANTVSGGKSS
jgi:hypothetical protein